MVKEHSDNQNLEGLKHALRAAIEKSSVAKESGRLCKWTISFDRTYDDCDHVDINPYSMLLFTGSNAS